MPYTRITSTKNVAACIEYMRGHGHGHNAEEVRNQYVSGIGLLNDGSIPFDVQMGWTLRHRNSRNKVDAFRVIQGFGPEELNADNPEDVFLAHQIGLDLAEKMCSYWANFFKTGDPNGCGRGGEQLPEWKSYNESGAAMRFIHDAKMGSPADETELTKFLVSRELK